MPIIARAAHRLLSPLPVAAVMLVCVAPGTAQMRPTLIQGATILTGDGRAIEKGAVLIQGDKITSVVDADGLAKLDAPFLTKKVRGKGKFITPGFIDVWSTLALRANGSSDNPTARAAESWDRFDSDAIKGALAQGVTTIYIPALSREGFGGTGAVVRLIPDGSAAEVLLKDAGAMCVTLGGLSSQGAIGRISAATTLRRMFDEAKQHREAQDFYKEDLEEYEKKLKERVEKEAAESKDAPPKPDEKKEVKKDPPKTDEPKKPAPPPGGPRRRPPRPSVDTSDGVSLDDEADDDLLSVGLTAGDEPSKPEGGKPDEEKKKDELQKPAEPARDAAKEALFKVLDGDLALRVAADRPEDILNALEVAETFNLRLVIEGGAGAQLVAERLKERDTPVVLRAESPPLQFVGGGWRYHTPNAAATLRAAGVRVYCGSGPGAASATRQLGLRAAQLVGRGMRADDALALITSNAAKLLGIDEQTGRVAPGLAADLVIWSDHPLNPGARVERVYINGQEVYRAGKDNDKDEES